MATIKIPILGIENAGKTSLITTLKKEFEELTELKPTKKIERSKLEFFDKKIVVWDFGGQEKYRRKYKKKADKYFDGIDKEAFFVIDIQDSDKFSESIEYFGDILEALEKNAPETTINLLIHKLDPGMEKEKEIMDTFSDLSAKVMRLAKSFKVRITHTTIYNPISVIRAFNKPIFGNTTLYDNFSLLLKDFVDETGAAFAIIFTDELLEIGNYFSEDVDQKQMKQVADKVYKSYDDGKFNLADLSLEEENLSIQILDFQPKDEKYFFTYGFNNKRLSSSQIQPKAFNLLNDIKKFMKFM